MSRYTTLFVLPFVLISIAIFSSCGTPTSTPTRTTPTSSGASNSSGGTADSEKAVQELLLSSKVIVATANRLGYKLDAVKADVINEKVTKTYSITNVKAGERLKFVGRGDGDVNDLDLSVYSPSGSKMGGDTLTDNLPEVNLVAPQSGTYQVKVTLYDTDGGVAGAFVLFCFSK